MYWGNMRTHTDLRNGSEDHTTTIAYDDNFAGSGNLNTYAYPTLVTDALNHTTRTKYDYNTGLVVQSTDGRGQNTAFSYDLFNRPLSIVEPNGLTTVYTYDFSGYSLPNVLEQVQAGGITQRQAVTLFDKFYRTTANIQADSHWR